MGPKGPHENPFNGVAHAQASELRSKWEKRKIYPPRGTQVHLLSGKTSPHAHDPPNPSGLKALFSRKLSPTPLLLPDWTVMCPCLLQDSLGSSLPGHKPHKIVMISSLLCLGTANPFAGIVVFPTPYPVHGKGKGSTNE